LSEHERILFGRLWVFAGGWSLAAVEAVGAGEGIDEEDVLDLLLRLVDKSLVGAETAAGGAAARYRMLEPLRQYAREKLEERGEAEAVLSRHAAFFLALARDTESGSSGALQGASLQRLEEEHANFRAALSWSVEGKPGIALGLALALARFWEARSYFSEGRTWLEAALRKNEGVDVAVRARALTEAGTFAWYQGDYDQAIVFHARALRLYRELGDEHGVAFALMCLGAQETEKKGDTDRAASLFEEALSLSRRIGDQRTSAFVLANLATVERHRGNHGRAIALNREALSISRDLEDTSMVVAFLSMTARDTAYYGAHEAAIEFIEEGLPLARDLKSGYYVALLLEGLAALAGAKGNAGRAARLWGAAEALREDAGAPNSPVDLPVHERNVAAARAQMDETAWEEAWGRGCGHDAGGSYRLRPLGGRARPLRVFRGRARSTIRWDAIRPHPPREGGGGPPNEGFHQRPHRDRTRDKRAYGSYPHPKHPQEAERALSRTGRCPHG
jgi:tetratricopeptide (TPR) repeat protein